MFFLLFNGQNTELNIYIEYLIAKPLDILSSFSVVTGLKFLFLIGS